MNFQKIMACYLIAMNFYGCATMSGSLVTGAVAGVATGAAIGVGVANDKGTGALAGSLIGAGVGLVGSYLVHNVLEKRDANVRRDTLLNLERFGVEGVPSDAFMYPDPFGSNASEPKLKKRSR